MLSSPAQNTQITGQFTFRKSGHDATSRHPFDFQDYLLTDGERCTDPVVFGEGQRRYVAINHDIGTEAPSIEVT